VKTPSRFGIAFLAGFTVACALGLALALRVVEASANFIAANLAVGATFVLLARVWPTRWQRGKLILFFGALFSIPRVTEHYFPGHGNAIDSIFLAALGAFVVGGGVTRLFVIWYDKIREDEAPRTTT